MEAVSQWQLHLLSSHVGFWLTLSPLNTNLESAQTPPPPKHLKVTAARCEHLTDRASMGFLPWGACLILKMGWHFTQGGPKLDFWWMERLRSGVPVAGAPGAAECGGSP